MMFKQWVISRHITDTPRGDFVADVRGDKKFPDTINDPDALYLYLYNRGACREAIDEAMRAWPRLPEMES